MPTLQTLESIPVSLLLERVRRLRQEGYRLVQISATTLPEHLELTYSFDRAHTLVNLRLLIPRETGLVPSISSVYWAAFIYENEMHDLFKLQVEGMAVDFGGQFYHTAVKYPFGSTKAPTAKATPAAAKPASAKSAASLAQAAPVATAAVS
jgi:ech hydrogenase subunit D